MHHIRLKRAENLLKGVEPANYHVVLAENKFSDSEIQEYLAQKNFGIEPIQETDNVEVKAAIVETPKQTKSKMQLKELETPEGWAKYNELKLEAPAYLMCPHLEIQVTRKFVKEFDANLNKIERVVAVQLDKESPIGETVVSPVMVENLNCQLEGNKNSMVYYVQKSIFA